MSFGISTIRDIVVVLVPMILSLTVHEFAHAWSAYKLGDDTAASQGRMTLNPIVHIDILGTLILPIISVLNPGLGFIGWAKPVPVSPYRFNRKVTMHQGMLITALAGPASNMILAFLFGGLAMIFYSDQINGLAPHIGGGRIGALVRLGDSEFIKDNAQYLLQLGVNGFNPLIMLTGRVFIINIILAIFNMIPVYPLDGSRMLPFGLQQQMARYTMLVFLGLIILMNRAGNILWVPASFVGNLLLGLWSFLF